MKPFAFSLPRYTLALSLPLFGLFLVLFMGTAHADYSNLRHSLPYDDSQDNGVTITGSPNHYINITDANSRDIGGSGANHPAAYIKVYTQNPNGTHAIHVNFHNVYDKTSNCTSSHDPGITFQALKTGADENSRTMVGSAAGYNINNSNSCTDGGYTFSIPSTAFTLSSPAIPEHSGVYTAAVQILAYPLPTNWTDASHSYFFDVSSSSTYSSVDTRIAIAPFSDDQKGTALYPEADKSKAGWGYHTLSMPFQAYCSLSDNLNTPIRYGEDDYGTGNQAQGTYYMDGQGVSHYLAIHLLVYNNQGNQLPNITDPNDPHNNNPDYDGDVIIARDAATTGTTSNPNDLSARFRPGQFTGTDNASPSGKTYLPGQNGYPGSGWKQNTKYIFTYEYVTGGNGIWFQAPFDSGSTKFNCPTPQTPLPPSTTVTCNNVVVQDAGSATVGGTFYGTTRTLVARWGSNPDITVFPDVVADSASKTYNYTATGQDDPVSNTNPVNGSPGDGGQDRVHLRLVRQYKDSSGNWQNYDTGNEDFYSVKCHQAACVVNSVGVAGSRDDGRVVVGQQYTYYATVMNTGGPEASTLTPQLSGADLSLTINGIKNTILPNPSWDATPIPPGGVAAFSFTSTAFPNPDNSGHPYTATFGAYPDYYGGLGPLDYSGSCSTSFPVYVPFTLTPDAHATLTPDTESPNALQYDATIANSSTTNVYAPVYACIYRYKDPASDPAGCSSGVIHGTYNGGTYGAGTNPLSGLNGSDALPLGSYNAGDEYCAYLHMDYTTGIVGPGGANDVVPSDGVTVKHPSCNGVSNEPYVHFVGSSVMAGGGFEGENNCTTTTGAIHTFTKTTGQQARGSGVQFGAEALDVIEGLNSANLRTGPPVASTGLSFSNTQNANGSGLPAAALGGKLAAYGSCWPDYFGRKPASAATASPAIAATVGTAGAQYYKPASTFTLSGGTIGGTSFSQTIYVEGKDVYINGNGITYSGASGWQNLTDIPSFMLVVKGGNIYIDQNVTQLDGIYVAQPDNSGTGGNINTCATAPGAAVPGSQIYGNACNKQLVVNGAFMAKKIFLNRSFSSLRYSQNGENSFYSPVGHACGNANLDVPAGVTSATDCAAEIFNFSPEMYLTQPNLDPKNGPTTGHYDYVTSLSPVL